MKKQLRNGLLILCGLWTASLLIACAGNDSSEDASGSCQVSGDSMGPTEGIINGKTLDSSSRIALGVAYIETEFSNGESGMCTASLIAPDLLLTAAHCVRHDARTSREKTEATIAVFSTDPVCSMRKKHDVATARRIRKVVSHPNYGGDALKRYDLALVFLSAPAPVSARPLKLSLKDEYFSDSDSVYIAGYGRQTDLDHSGNGGDSKLRYTQLRTTATSAREWDPSFLVLHNDEGTAGCKGDSGGPALKVENGQLTIVGVASIIYNNDWGNANCRSRIAYTRPSAYRDWLIDNSEGRIRP